MEEITFRNKREDLEAYHDYMLKETEEGKQIGKRVFIARPGFAILIMGLFFLLIWGIRGYLGASIQSTVFLAIGFVLLMIFVERFVLLMMGFQPYYYVGKQVLKKNVQALTEKDFRYFNYREPSSSMKLGWKSEVRKPSIDGDGDSWTPLA